MIQRAADGKTKLMERLNCIFFVRLLVRLSLFVCFFVCFFFFIRTFRVQDRIHLSSFSRLGFANEDVYQALANFQLISRSYGENLTV